MRNFYHFFLIIFFAFQLFAQENLNIAVLELEGAGISKTDLIGLSNRLRSELFKTGKFTVLERSRMDEILKEQGFQLSGCTNTDCAVEIGKLIGVSKIILGNVDKVGTIYTVDIRIVDVSTGKIENIATQDCENCNLNEVLLNSIQNVARIIAGLKEVNKKLRVTSLPNIQAKSFSNSSSELTEWEKLGISRSQWVEYKRSNFNTYNEYKKWEKKNNFWNKNKFEFTIYYTERLNLEHIDDNFFLISNDLAYYYKKYNVFLLTGTYGTGNSFGAGAGASYYYTLLLYNIYFQPGIIAGIWQSTDEYFKPSYDQWEIQSGYLYAGFSFRLLFGFKKLKLATKFDFFPVKDNTINFDYRLHIGFALSNK